MQDCTRHYTPKCKYNRARVCITSTEVSCRGHKITSLASTQRLCRGKPPLWAQGLLEWPRMTFQPKPKAVTSRRLPRQSVQDTIALPVSQKGGGTTDVDPFHKTGNCGGNYTALGEVPRSESGANDGGARG